MLLLLLLPALPPSLRPHARGFVRLSRLFSTPRSEQIFFGGARSFETHFSSFDAVASKRCQLAHLVSSAGLGLPFPILKPLLPWSSPSYPPSRQRGP